MGKSIKNAITNAFPLCAKIIKNKRFILHLKMKHVSSIGPFFRSQWTLPQGKEMVKIELNIKSGYIRGIKCSEVFIKGMGNLVGASTLIALLDGFCISTRTTRQLVFQGMKVVFYPFF